MGDSHLSPGLVGALLESIADAVYVVDGRGAVRFANPAALTILGYTAEELIGRPSHATIHHRRPDGTPYPEEECPLLRPRVTGETVREEDEWFVRRDGSFVPVSYSSSPFAAEDGRGAVVIFRDETERRATEAAARREAAERARADAVAASRARIVDAADAERRRVGRDLHDGVQQRLMTITLAVQEGLGLISSDPSAAKRTLEAGVTEARAALGELRDLVAGVHPSILVNRGLAAATRSLTARATMPVVLAIPETRWSARVEVTAYYAVAEALANVAKHAGATRAEVEVTEDDGELLVEVRDDGVGGARLRPGRGLMGLRDRVEAIGGTLAVRDGAVAGSVLQMRLPLR